MNAPLRSSTKHGFAVSNNGNGSATRAPRRLLPALLALGGTCGLAAGPASGLELGPIDVQSALGTPLRASISYALNPQEAIHDYCIYLRPGRTASGLPSIDRASIALSNGTILLTGREVLREPLLSLQLAVDCPGAARLTREYSVFLSPWMPSTQSEPAPATQAERTSAVPALATQAERAAAVPASSTHAERQTVVPAPATSREIIEDARPIASGPSADRTPIGQATTYRVQRGDTLSGVAQRIPDRTIGIWQAVDVIFAANPDAFIDNNRDLLKAGALLHIPASLSAAENNQGARQSASAEAAPPAEPARDRSPAGTPSADSFAEGQVTTTVESPAVANVPQDLANAGEASLSDDNASPVPTADTALESASPFVPPVESSAGARTDAATFEPPVEVIPETAIDAPATQRSATAERTDGTANGSWTWLIWLGGTGVALILALLLFGRTLRSRFGGNAGPIAEEPELNRRKTDSGGDLDDARQPAADPEPEFGFDDAAPESSAASLDGDLEDGSGFQDNGDIDVAQDFGFSPSDDLRLGLDLEFSDGPTVRLEDDETAVLGGTQRLAGSIALDEAQSEDFETGDFDISMIDDAKLQPVRDSDETTKDLKALELEAADATQADEDEEDDESYTLDHEVDYRILEQDYEDELTATQALNVELAQAARELRANIDDRKASQSEDDSVNEEMTAEMPAAENDATAAIELEPATLDTKKSDAKKTGT